MQNSGVSSQGTENAFESGIDVNQGIGAKADTTAAHTSQTQSSSSQPQPTKLHPIHEQIFIAMKQAPQSG